MSFGLNMCTFAGRITEDIKLREKDGNTFAYFTIAVNYPDSTNKDGEKVKRDPDFINFSVNGAIAQIFAKRGKKGTYVVISNVPEKSTTRKVEKDGTTTIYHDVIHPITSKSSFDFPESDSQDNSGGQAKATKQQMETPAADTDDDFMGDGTTADYESADGTPAMPPMTENEDRIMNTLPF